MFHGLGYKAVRILAYEYATRLGRNVPDSWNHGKISGRDWMSGFKSRHKNLCLRSPEATSIARTHGFNKKVVYLLFSFLSEAFVKHKFEANVVYNLDESGITTVQRVPKVIAEKGTKQVGHITAQERGTLVTVCCCANAAGQALPQAMIFPSHPGRRITIYDLPACFARSFYKAFSYDNIVQGFKSAGVFPLNSDIFTEEDFLPSTVFKPPQPHANLANRSDHWSNVPHGVY